MPTKKGHLKGVPKARRVEIVGNDIVAKVRNSPNKKNGRPLLTHTMFNEICERVASGESMLSICKDTKYPQYQTVYAHIFGHGATIAKAGFREKYEHARLLQMAKYTDEIMDAAHGKLPYYNDEFGMERVARDQLRIKTMQYMIGVFAPKLIAREEAASEMPKLIDAPKVQDMDEWVARQKAKANGD